MRKTTAFLSMLLATWLSASSAYAALPDSGWYYNAAQSGQGSTSRFRTMFFFSQDSSMTRAAIPSGLSLVG